MEHIGRDMQAVVRSSCVCVRACVRACVCVCVCIQLPLWSSGRDVEKVVLAQLMCVCVCVCVYSAAPVEQWARCGEGGSRC